LQLLKGPQTPIKLRSLHDMTRLLLIELRVRTKRFLLLLALLLIVGQSANAQSIDYNRYGLKIELSDDVQLAIDSGISLTFEHQISRTDNLFFVRWRSLLVQHDFVITRHTLSNRYLVHESNKLEPRIFTSTRESMAYISEASLARFSEYNSKQNRPSSIHKMRLRLSKTKLPGPIRLTAFIANDWDLNSGWKLWQSDQ